MEETESTSLVVATFPSPNSTDLPTGMPVVSNPHDYGTTDGTSRHSKKSGSSASLEVLMESFSESEMRSEKRPTMLTRFWIRNKFYVFGLLLLVFAAVWRVTETYKSAIEPAVPWQQPNLSKPFSTLDPKKDLKLLGLVRPDGSSPPEHVLRTSKSNAVPTNSWYQNLILGRGDPSPDNRVYTIPYILDVVGSIPGLRIHPTHIDSSTNVMQLSTVNPYGLTIGAATESGMAMPKNSDSKRYSVVSSTPLAISLKWDAFPMSSSIVRGMAYATMHYPRTFSSPQTGGPLLPTIASEISLLQVPTVDGGGTLPCPSKAAKSTRVERELKLTFADSDFTWLVFFSEPVLVQCIEQTDEMSGGTKVMLQIADFANNVDSKEATDDLTIRVALLTSCTSGNKNPIHCYPLQSDALEAFSMEEYGDVLRTHAHMYPGPNSDIEMAVNEERDEVTTLFDWDVRDMSATSSLRRLGQMSEFKSDMADSQLLMFALPHHMDMLDDSFLPRGSKFCLSSLLGAACLVKGKSWALVESLTSVSFRAPRPPRADTLHEIAKALKDDIKFRVTDLYRRGEGDTYFSGKMLAKAARILVIADEATELCASHEARGYSDLANSSSLDYKGACKNLSLPAQSQLKDMLSTLREATEVWINGTATTPFVYDSEWGGVISCGCIFDEKTKSCPNLFPNCPSVSDPGLDFGNGFYNDHHFHYGYHIYAAAAVASFDPEWGRKHFEEVLLLIRDFANPSEDDVHFPRFRQKDFYQGHSWASGIAVFPMNGRNQESSSEAIASYEAVALFGSAMVDAWQAEKNTEKAETANRIKNVGRVLLTSELRSADKYYHVRQERGSSRVYPTIYKPNVIGIMWNTMAQFQTWFGLSPFLAYGIQLLPLTSVSEQRDQLDWLSEMYLPFSASCSASPVCEEQGWSVLQLAMLASVGHVYDAIEKAVKINPDVFESAGGNGHSLTNTLWYISTRPSREPLPLPKVDSSSQSDTVATKKVSKVDCGVDTCTDEVLDTDAGGYPCRGRITFLMNTLAKSGKQACSQVSWEYPDQCGLCNPGSSPKVKSSESDSEDATSFCPPCSKEQCHSELSRCPLFDRTFVCSSGLATGGCIPVPWQKSVQCEECCELTSCSDYEASNESDDETNALATDTDEGDLCKPCSAEVCKSKLNLCPVREAPFLCTSGMNKGGCSPHPWDLSNGNLCSHCCKISVGCEGNES